MRKKFLVIMDGEAFEVEVEVEEGKSPLETVLSVMQTGVVRKVETPPLGKGVVSSPITGRVSRLTVKKGDRVEAGDVVALLEAMKTIVEVKAGNSGTVVEIYVSEGAVVKQGEPLLKIE